MRDPDPEGPKTQIHALGSRDFLLTAGSNSQKGLIRQQSDNWIRHMSEISAGFRIRQNAREAAGWQLDQTPNQRQVLAFESDNSREGSRLAVRSDTQSTIGADL
jgi:hypothetical protein